MSSLNEVVKAERLHIAIFGKRNAGKSSLINALTGQPTALVSAVKGTTTDPVEKAMELLPLGPIVLIDTAGFDDAGELGERRVEMTRKVLAKTDIALLITEGDVLDAGEREFVAQFGNKPYLIVYNKAERFAELPQAGEREIYVSAQTGLGIEQLKKALGQLAGQRTNEKRVVADLLTKGDRVILVTPIDAAAPKGRIILPQQQTLRDILDAGCSAVVCQPEQLADVLSDLRTPPKMIITDSQVFGKVAPLVPTQIPLTSFSILFARYKGDLMEQVRGAAALSSLQAGDRVLISEGCTHHRQCGDIGTQKLPRWITEFVGAAPQFEFTSGADFPEDLSPYRLVVHCGGCMLTETQMAARLSAAKAADTPVVNYGVAIAHIHGILKRSLELFPEALNLLK